MQAAHSPAPHRGRGGCRPIRPAKLPQRAGRSVSFAEAPARRPQDAPTGWDSIRPPAAGARFSFPEPILRGRETLPPIPGLSGSAYLRGAMAGGIGW